MTRKKRTRFCAEVVSFRKTILTPRDWAFLERVSLGAGVFSTSHLKIGSRQPRPMKVGSVIPSINFYKICNFGSHIL